MKPASAYKETKRLSGHKLMVRLVLSGTKICCDFRGCPVIAATHLDVHHVVPIMVQINNSVNNLRLLCDDHHALIEEFYWQTRKREDPENTSRIEELVPLLSDPAADRKAVIEELKQCWAKSNKVFNKNAAYWVKLYGQAKEWAQTKKVIVPTNPGRIVAAKDWYIDIKKQS